MTTQAGRRLTTKNTNGTQEVEKPRKTQITRNRSTVIMSPSVFSVSSVVNRY